MEKDFFSHKSDGYEKEKRRVDNVKNIADAIKEKIVLKKSMKVLDFGSGTGLLTEKIAPFVSEMTTIDMSKSMNEKLKQKKFTCKLKVIEADMESYNFGEKFDLIISSMSTHHIKDVSKLFAKFYDILNPNGYIAIADLDKEDGSFHTQNTGVHHFGFSHDEFKSYAQRANFIHVHIKNVSIVKKPYGDFPVFLLVGKKLD